MGIPITNQLVITRAKFIIDQKNIQTECEFSTGWLTHFKQRYNIVNRKAGSKLIRKDDIELDALIAFVKKVNKKINSGYYDSIMNFDETGLYYDSKIEYTLDIKGAQRVEIKTTGREKQRISIIFGIDLLDKIDTLPFIILKGTTKRSINHIPQNDSYRLSFQDNAWCDEDQFILFLSCLPKDKKILLLYDNFKAHKTKKVMKYLSDQYPLIDILLLPPNTTSILQPLDVGVNKTVKNHIKNEYMNWLINNFDNDNKTLPKLAKHERDKLLVQWISNGWEKIDTNIIKNSFNFCGYGITENIDPEWMKYYIKN